MGVEPPSMGFVGQPPTDWAIVAPSSLEVHRTKAHLMLLFWLGVNLSSDVASNSFHEWSFQKDSSLRNYFDFSEYPEIHPLYNIENKKVVGKFKDELNGLIMEELVALKPKQYAYKIAQETRENFIEYYNQKIQEEKKNPKLPKVPKPGDENKKSKGIKKNVVNSLNVEDFRDSLFNKTIVRKKQYCIRSIKQTLYTQEQEKVVFDNEDTDAKLLHFKRVILPNSYETQAYGFNPLEATEHLP